MSSWLSRHPFILFVVLYAVVFGAGVFGVPLLPEPLRAAAAALTNNRGLGVADPAAFGQAAQVVAPTAPLWALASVAMVAAGALSLPVAWLYTITRQKRGYRQSVVQTLILLPVVVAGVVVLVKFSLALAFSLAGIVAAVRFRNTLEDSKDAVFIFVATGIGLAAGVELSAAATLSFVFNLATLLLFVTDFGRAPAGLEGEIADEAMKRALSGANRTSQFVARIDREILEDMAPQQLEALAMRAMDRRRENEEGGAVTDAPRLDRTLRVHAIDAARARKMVELLLAVSAKRWELRSEVTSTEGDTTLEYAVRLRKGTSAPALMSSVRADKAAVRDAEFL
jgi:hypothetical protein